MFVSLFSFSIYAMTKSYFLLLLSHHFQVLCFQIARTEDKGQSFYSPKL
jgi:hypothetical protein